MAMTETITAATKPETTTATTIVMTEMTATMAGMTMLTGMTMAAAMTTGMMETTTMAVTTTTSVYRGPRWGTRRRVGAPSGGPAPSQCRTRCLAYDHDDVTKQLDVALERFGLRGARARRLRQGFVQIFRVTCPARGEFCLRMYDLLPPPASASSRVSRAIVSR
jgi:hypothetical protein